MEPDARGKGAKSTVDIFATIREALKAKEVVGLGHAVIGRRERPVMIQARGKGMIRRAATRSLSTRHRPITGKLEIQTAEAISAAGSVSATPARCSVGWRMG